MTEPSSVAFVSSCRPLPCAFVMPMPAEAPGEAAGEARPPACGTMPRIVIEPAAVSDAVGLGEDAWA